jgi:hypothetical protein
MLEKAMSQIQQLVKEKKIGMDVTGTVDVTDPRSVCTAVLAIFNRRYPDSSFVIIDRLYQDFAKLYRGELEGFLACDTSYHDIQHVLDVSLAMARLIDGYEQTASPEEHLGPELALLGLVIALFHDSGYIRRADEQVSHGAEYTKIHVSRSAQFMAEYLPSIDMSRLIPLSSKLVHFTGYEYKPEDIDVSDERHRVIGCLAGTADVLAQMADPAYLEKCRDHLYPEFELGGIARQQLADGSEQVIYASPEDLLTKTPEFIKSTITNRLNGHFKGMYHHVAAHFDGRNLYMEALERNCHYLEGLLKENDPSLLVSHSLRP